MRTKLKKLQDAQADANQLPVHEANIHRDEIAVDPFEAQELCRSSRIRTIP